MFSFKKQFFVQILLSFIFLIQSCLLINSVSFANPSSAKVSSFQPPIIHGITIHPENPMKLDFIVDVGDDQLSGKAFTEESQKLINYFMTSLTIPENQMWVNLSPYEENRIIPTIFGKTEMGRDLLEQDYQLKKITSSLLNPNESIGDEFWQKVYDQVEAKYGTSNLPLNTFNKIWIVPETAEIHVHDKNVFVINSRLAVLLEEDYLLMEMNQNSTEHGLGDVSKKDLKELTQLATEVIREIIVPAIEEEVNHGKTFANLRQIFNSMILAVWYKQNLKQSLLSEIYIDQQKVAGVELQEQGAINDLYQRYLGAFNQGKFDFIKERFNSETQDIIYEKYVSGGVDGAQLGEVLTSTIPIGVNPFESRDLRTVSIDNTPVDSSMLASPKIFSGLRRVQEQDSFPEQIFEQLKSVTSLQNEETLREMINEYIRTPQKRKFNARLKLLLVMDKASDYETALNDLAEALKGDEETEDRTTKILVQILENGFTRNQIRRDILQTPQFFEKAIQLLGMIQTSTAVTALKNIREAMIRDEDYHLLHPLVEKLGKDPIQETIQRFYVDPVRQYITYRLREIFVGRFYIPEIAAIDMPTFLDENLQNNLESFFSELAAVQNTDARRNDGVVDNVSRLAATVNDQLDLFDYHLSVHQVQESWGASFVPTFGPITKRVRHKRSGKEDTWVVYVDNQLNTGRENPEGFANGWKYPVVIYSRESIVQISAILSNTEDMVVKGEQPLFERQLQYLGYAGADIKDHEAVKEVHTSSVEPHEMRHYHNFDNRTIKENRVYFQGEALGFIDDYIGIKNLRQLGQAKRFRNEIHEEFLAYLAQLAFSPDKVYVLGEMAERARRTIQAQRAGFQRDLQAHDFAALEIWESFLKYAGRVSRNDETSFFLPSFTFDEGFERMDQNYSFDDVGRQIFFYFMTGRFTERTLFDFAETTVNDRFDGVSLKVGNYEGIQVNENPSLAYQYLTKVIEKALKNLSSFAQGEQGHVNAAKRYISLLSRFENRKLEYRETSVANLQQGDVIRVNDQRFIVDDVRLESEESILVYVIDEEIQLQSNYYRSIEVSTDQRVELAYFKNEPDRSMTADVGGIDFNPASLELKVTGDMFEMELPVNLEYLRTSPIEGLSPIIIDVRPVTNLNLILGLKEESDPVELSRTP